MRIHTRVERAQFGARILVAALDQRVFLQIRRAAEERLEGRMQIGVDEGDPAIDLGAATRGAVATQAGQRCGVGDIVEDRRILGQCPLVDHQQRHRAGRIQA